MPPELKIRNVLQIQGKYKALAELTHSDDIHAYVAELKAGLLRWYSTIPQSAEAEVSVFTTFRRPKEIQQAFAESVCATWNEDAEMRDNPRLLLQISIGTNAETFFQCSTFGSPYEPAGHQPMQVFDCQQLMEVADRERQKREDAERERRRASPVTTPVPVPPWITWEIAAYLRLEYGETFFSRDSVKPWQLKYIGEYVVDGVPTRYWQYPTSDKIPHYATVERFGSHYSLGMTDQLP